MQVPAGSGESRTKTRYQVRACSLITERATLWDCRRMVAAAVTRPDSLPDTSKHLFAGSVHKSPNYYQIVSMDDFVVSRSTDYFAHLLAAQPADALDITGRIIAQTAREFNALLV